MMSFGNLVATCVGGFFGILIAVHLFESEGAQLAGTVIIGVPIAMGVYQLLRAMTRPRSESVKDITDRL